MMINKRLIGSVTESKKYIAANVLLQWCALLASIAMMGMIAKLLQQLEQRTAHSAALMLSAGLIVLAVVVRLLCTVAAGRMAHHSCVAVKKTLRRNIYEKLLRLGAAYHEHVKTSEIVQVAVEGVDQLETYFGSYLPQLFYSLLAPLTLFVVLCFVNVPSAAVLLVCVPMIPIAIAAVQTWAKKLLARYWGQYTAMGDTFLENLQGLATLKIYQADERRHREMNEQAEQFRKITMKVLTMQLNSITIMDLVAYGGAALGMIVAILQYQAGQIELEGCLLVLLLAADFFLPMRLLGSFFHIAMNGMAASDKIFRLLDLPEPMRTAQTAQPADSSVSYERVHFGYDNEREILHGVTLRVPAGGFVALVGESGSGKSTMASLLTGRIKSGSGQVLLGGQPLACIDEQVLMRSVTYVGHQSYLMKGTVRDNLLMASPQADDAQLWQVLERVKLADFLRAEQGLNTLLLEKGENFSGGQRQRLALARALLHDSPVYVFDEATSNIDVESETDMMAEIRAISGKKTVLVISHRLANTVDADTIYVLEKGRIVEQGTHELLLERGGLYERLWTAQQQLEQCGVEVRR